MPGNERYTRIKEAVSAAQVARDHGRETRSDGAGREKALCPFHNDHNPSLKFFSDGGYKCFVCEASGDAISLEQHLGGYTSPSEAASGLEERYGLQSSEPSRNGPQKSKKKRVKEVVRREEVARWMIRDENGEVCAQHRRYKAWDAEGNEGKEYSYRNPDGSYTKGAIKPKELPLYGSEWVNEYDPDELVAVAEGEQAIDAARRAGLPAVGTASGTNVIPNPERLEVLRGLRVALWPDNDDPGRKHMAALAEALEGIAAEVRWFEWKGAPEKGDAADHPAIISGNGKALWSLEVELQNAPLYDPAQHRPEETGNEDNANKPGAKESSGKPPTPADRLIGYVMAESHELLLDQFGAPHILWQNGEPVALNSSFDHHLRRLCFEKEGKSASSDAVRQARQTIAAFALGCGEVRELHIRAAFREGKLYYQLGVGRVFEIDRDGYRTVENSPVLFRALRNLQPLPDPENGGLFDVLGRWVNLKNARDKRMYIAWLITAVLPHIPRPMLEATGVMGSGKTTAGRVAKRALDPGKPETVRPDPREFLQKASHAHIIMLDNQNSLPEWAVDTLCRLVTGEADSKRVLYSDDEDVIYEMRRAVILNGINAPTDRGDARDRTLPVELERIPETEYRPEEEMWAEFEAEHPKLLGAVFKTLSGALRAKETLSLDRRGRLADWSEYAAAVYEVMGWGAEKFTEDWGRVVKIQNQGTLEGSSLAQAILHYMESRAEWEGLSTDLHAALEVEAEEMNIDVKRDKSWPKSPSWLWRRTKEVKPLLTALGIDARREVERGGTRVFLRRVEDASSLCGSTDEDCGSKFEMLPQMLPHHTPYSHAGSGDAGEGCGSSGSISGYSGNKLSRAIDEEESNYPQKSEKRPDSAPERDVGRKVSGNAATATDAATGGVLVPTRETHDGEAAALPDGELTPRERLRQRVAQRLGQQGQAEPEETL